MKEKPILFSGEMVRANLDGRKTMTRRVVNTGRFKQDAWNLSVVGADVYRESKDNVVFNSPCGIPAKAMQDKIIKCPYGKRGDRLWVRETWRVGAWDENDCAIAIDYRADGFARQEWLYVPNEKDFEKLWIQSSLDADAKTKYTWEPGQSPCRWRSSIFMPRWASRTTLEITNVRVERLHEITRADIRREGVRASSSHRPVIFDFTDLWDSINEKRGYSWESNPLVWVIEYNVLNACITASERTEK